MNILLLQDQRLAVSRNSLQTRPWLPPTSGSGLASSTSVTTDTCWWDPRREVAYRPDSTQNFLQFVDVSLAKIFKIQIIQDPSVEEGSMQGIGLDGLVELV